MSTDPTIKRTSRRAAAAQAQAPATTEPPQVQPDGAVLDESNKAVLDPPAEPSAPKYSDVILFLQAGDKESFVYGETEAEARALFREWAEADGVEVPDVLPPIPGDRVLIAHVDGDARVLLMYPFQNIVLKLAA